MRPPCLAPKPVRWPPGRQPRRPQLLAQLCVPFSAAPMDFSAWFEVFLGDRWCTCDARHNRARIGRIVMAQGRDAGDVPIVMGFGQHSLLRFDVITHEI